MARTRSQHRREDPAVDLTKSDMPKRPDPEAALTRIVGLYERFVRTHPEKAEALLERCRELTERYRPLGTERVLTTAEAVIFSGLSRARVTQLARDGRIGERVEEQFRYSEAELHEYMQSPRKPGPRPRRG